MNSNSAIIKTLKIWMDHPVYILAGGPSIRDQNLNLLKNKIVVGVNNSYLFGDLVTCCWFGDKRWFFWHEEALKKYKGLIFTCAPEDSYPKRVIRFERDLKKKYGISPDPLKVSWNGNSGASAIDFSIKMGASKIILLGFDMTISKDNLTHWHGGHKQGSMAKNLAGMPYNRFLQSFKPIKEDCDRLGIEVINTSPISRIKEFPFMSLEKCVNIN